MRRFVSMVGFVLVSCGGAQALNSASHSSKSSAAIINGTVDTTHQAVVALLSQNTECSGTIVQVKGGNAYVLTAAHCCASNVLPQVAIMGNNYQTGQQYSIIQSSIKQDPNNNLSAGSSTPLLHDFCMLQFSGASASTPVIPVTTSPDGLAVGTTVDIVGFGETQAGSTSNNSQRYQKSSKIAYLDQTILRFNQEATGQDGYGDGDPSNGGACEGDSGGPAIYNNKVVGVTSYGDQNCADFGVSGRVSLDIGSNSFITEYLNNQPISTQQDCPTCENAVGATGGACSSQANACGSDSKCTAFSSCIGNCGANDSTCVTNCANTAGDAAVDELLAYENCTCDSCSVCSSSDCQGWTCGNLADSSTGCGACINSSCCSQESACSGDASCLGCLVSNPPASCSSNSNYQELLSCIDSSCDTSSTCAPPSTSSSTGTSGVTSGTSSGQTSGTSSGQTTGTNAGTTGSSGPDQCKSCSSAADCNSGEICVTENGQGGYCAPTCTGSGDCGSGLACTPDGSVSVCYPSSGTCNGFGQSGTTGTATGTAGAGASSGSSGGGSSGGCESAGAGDLLFALFAFLPLVRRRRG